MPSSPENRDPLEPLITRTLRAQPLRRAPRTLEGRVLAELARRAALPWWHKSYTHWPVAVRGGFFVLSALIAGAIVAAIFLLTHSSSPSEVLGEIVDRFSWLAIAREVLATVAEKTLVLWRAIPPLWLYGAAALIAAGYAILVGVGAAAYRAFFAPR